MNRIYDNAAVREVPPFQASELGPKSAPYCVCLFVINENGKLHKQLKRMHDAAISRWADIVIADGGSTDGSTDLAALGSFGVNTLLVKRGPGKLGAQMRMAFAWALERGYKGIVVIDGNNKDSVEDIPNFVRKLEEGFDHVQGSRFIAGGRHENTPLSRLVAVKAIHAPLMRLSSGFRYTDTTNGFRGYSRALLESPRIAPFRSVFAGYELHYYLAIRAAQLGFNCCEVPVTRKYPATGKIPTKISPIKGNVDVLVRLLSACLGRYNV
jgi:dolichol-phosphate mannosyltransferase